MNKDSKYDGITKSRFETPTDDVVSDLDCNEEKRDGFLKRIFSSKKKQRKFKGE
ncbi:hypothetical protein JCM19274_3181 [Algibacter lectus]|uniref:Uncharacterized protein n=1 Tax=Algibacter lectus TaxID=221126 RepID=A0A090WWH4_9FLAO|nr:hypothetical protein JCM19274_3181 [Algibacter lectus]